MAFRPPDPWDRLGTQNVLRQIMESYERFPGRAPGGTGPTGLTSNDAQGWSDILNEQRWAQEQLADRPLETQEAPFRERHVSPFGGPGAFSPNQASLAGLQAAMQREFGARGVR